MPELAEAVVSLSSGRPPLRFFARHDLCWLKRDEAALLRSANTLSVNRRYSPTEVEIAFSRSALLAWISAGRPLVATRQPADAAPDCCRLALCTPRGEAIRSIALDVPTMVIERVASPLLLSDSIQAAPASWRDSLHAMVRALAHLGLEARVFGSLAWQAITGLDYLQDQSDLDLIIDLSQDEWLTTITCAGGLSEKLSRWLALIDEAPFSLDCEVRLERDKAFSLAELRGSSRQVLARCNERSELVTRSKLRELAAC